MSKWIRNNLIPVLALIGTLFGGAGLEITRRWLNNKEIQDTTARDLRVELRDDLTGLKSELMRTQGELGRWRNRYYILVEQYIRNKADLDEALEELHDAGLPFERVQTMSIDELLGERKESGEEKGDVR